MASRSLEALAPRVHIQDEAAATSLEPHWGYADRVVPCANDAGSCKYLDVVYSAHDIGLIYTGIIWVTIGGIIFLWALLRWSGTPYSNALALHQPNEARGQRLGGFPKLRRSISATIRHYLLPDSVRIIFGRTTRLQVTVLATLTIYLTIWSFVGITYNSWITPVKKMPGVYNTRSSLGPWSDRIGVLAYAMMPLSIMLSSRESLLSLLTGVPTQSFVFLHRWLGYIIFIQSLLHTIGWCIIEARLYQPQPTTATEWIAQRYMIWGCVAMILLTILLVLSTEWSKRAFGYEFFRKSHYILAMVFIGACYGHWSQLRCFMVPSLLFWFLDRAARLLRTFFLHYHQSPSGGMAFQPASAVITRFPDSEHGDVIRLDMDNDQDPWSIGQHFYLCFTECSIWQSHPFTPLNAPIVHNGKVRHSYILRARSGETKKLAQLASAKVGGGSSSEAAATSVIATGPYGEAITERLTPDTNIVCVAGGTGITYVLPVLLELARQPLSPDRKVDLIWAMRHANNTAWVQQELDLLRNVSKALNLRIRLFATRDMGSGNNSSEDEDDSSHHHSGGEEKNHGISSTTTTTTSPALCECGDKVAVKKTGGAVVDEQRHPDLSGLINSFIKETIRGPTTVFASGPGGMISDLRSIVASCNSGSKVWRGEEKFDVNLVCDDRLEW